MTQQPKIGLTDRIRQLRRRTTPAVVAFASVFVIVGLAALLWPATYRSKGTILIEQQEVPVDIVRSMVSSYADQRIQVITQRVMTSENLFRIIDRYELFTEERRTTPREVLIDKVRNKIDFKMISADVVDPRQGRPTKATIAFSVSYDHRSPVIAAKVANELTTLYLNENVATRKQLADDTTSFLSSEAERLSNQIVGLETQLAEFKEKNPNSLPELKEMNLQFIARAEDEQRELDSRIRSLDQQIVYLDAQLAQLTPAAQIYTSTGERVLSPADRLKMLRSDYARTSALYAPDHPDVVRMKREIAGLESQLGKSVSAGEIARDLEKARGELAAAREHYGPEHPDVVKLERIVAGIESSAGATITAEADAEGADNPAYIQVKSQREAAINERASLQDSRQGVSRKITSLEASLTQAPNVEREYRVLARDLDNAQLKYAEVRQKQMEAKVSQNLEVERKSERFTLIEPPLVPEEPVSPNRKAILALGFLLALGAAAGIVFLLESLDSSVRSRRDLENLLTVPPLAVVPWMDTPQDRKRRVQRHRLAASGAVTSVLLGALMIHLFYRPLDVLWHVAMRKFGG
ncbi:MAG TPA: hypothetical protein VJU59_43630 [Paraburkholderia sp.]|uniref:hypothetical protein n=1 Tax=Paraburkholderia sp. TaxID=1926495 RepID=UPI002B481B32|nr:hypothetical protein [Paraburkholderia sp.]HKR46485.1 hypothetical protein [Paraburkholderia sp.]